MSVFAFAADETVVAAISGPDKAVSRIVVSAFVDECDETAGLNIVVDFVDLLATQLVVGVLETSACTNAVIQSASLLSSGFVC